MSINSSDKLTPFRDAILRWKHGHHVFHIQLTAINTMLEESSSAAEKGDAEGLVLAMCRMVALYDAATATMRYAADFPREMYENAVRPSMMPPFLSPGFSGVFNTEHRVMLNALKTLREVVFRTFGRTEEKWPEGLRNAWAALRRVKSANRETHGLVCEKCVENGVSLLREFYAKAKKPNVAVSSQ